MNKEENKLITILKETIKYLDEYKEIIIRDNADKNVMISGKEMNIIQLIGIWEDELQRQQKGDSNE